MYKFVYFKSGFGASIQAGKRSYCNPRDETGPYTTVELGFPTAREDLIMKWAENPRNPTDTVYGYVPAGVVRALTIKHGGVIEGTLPEFDMNAEQSCFLAEALLEVVNESR